MDKISRRGFLRSALMALAATTALAPTRIVLARNEDPITPSDGGYLVTAGIAGALYYDIESTQYYIGAQPADKGSRWVPISERFTAGSDDPLVSIR